MVNVRGAGVDEEQVSLPESTASNLSANALEQRYRDEGFAVARKLSEASVSVVNLATPRIGTLPAGQLAALRTALSEEGIAVFGGGKNQDEAWQPAVLERNGKRISFVGCTLAPKIEEGDPTHGAARCGTNKLTDAIADAAQDADLVVVGVDGADRYAQDAADAGAALVVGGGVAAPNAIGALSVEGQDGATVPHIDSHGYLAPHRSAWNLLPGYISKTTFANDRAVRTTADTYVINDGAPMPVSGRLADGVTNLLSIDTGYLPVRLEHGDADIPHEVAGEADDIKSLPTDSGVTAGPGYRLGRDLLLGSGSLQPSLTSSRETGEDPNRVAPALWDLGQYATTTQAEGCTADRRPDQEAEQAEPQQHTMLQLERSTVSEDDVVATPVNRIPVEPGQQLTVAANLRMASNGGTVELRWYPSANGPSTQTSTLELPSHSSREDECKPVSMDATVPEGMEAVGVYVRVTPTSGATGARRVVIGDLRLVQWSDEADAQAGSNAPSDPPFDTIGFKESATVPLNTRHD